MPRLSIRTFFTLLFLPIVASGCSASSNECAHEAIDGLGLVVADSVTGKDVCDAVVTVTDGAYEETLPASPLLRDGGAIVTCGYYGAHDRAGTYHIVVTRAGTKGAVFDLTVTDGDCHVTPASRNVALEAE